MFEAASGDDIMVHARPIINEGYKKKTSQRVDDLRER
jgi:hypothetical protein